MLSKEDLLNPARRHLFVFAHQDDEVLYAGLIQRLSSRGQSRFIWVTNGDGLAPEVGADPRDYARLRENECRDVLDRLGIPENRAEFLGYSEIAIYDSFVAIVRGKTSAAMGFFQEMAGAVEQSVQRASPDIVWTGAFQGGHPEHDLVHIMAARALGKLTTKGPIHLVQLPEYEWTILIPARFHPWYKGVVYDIRLTEQEVAKKRQVLEAYPSQVSLFAKFEKVMTVLGKAAKLVGRGFTPESFLSREVFSPMPPDKDYTRCPQPFNALSYIGEKHKGVRVSFTGALRPIVRHLFPSPP